MKYISQSTSNFRVGYIPKVEGQISQITSRIFPTNYAKANGHEWFAENFSLYSMGKIDLIDPKFIKLIEELQ